MKKIQVALVLIFLVQGLTGQSLICHTCNDCYTGGVQWDRRSCDDDSSVNPPTPPGLPPLLPNAYSADNDTTQGFQEIEPARNTFQCFTATFNIGGRHFTDRGCVIRGTNVQNTCNSIMQNNIPVHCYLCDTNECNNVSRILSSISVIAFALFLAMKL